MGHVVAQIELSNPREPDLVPIKTVALADTGSLMLCICLLYTSDAADE